MATPLLTAQEALAQLSSLKKFSVLQLEQVNRNNSSYGALVISDVNKEEPYLISVILWVSDNPSFAIEVGSILTLTVNFCRQNCLRVREVLDLSETPDMRAWPHEVSWGYCLHLKQEFQLKRRLTPKTLFGSKNAIIEYKQMLVNKQVETSMESNSRLFSGAFASPSKRRRARAKIQRRLQNSGLQGKIRGLNKAFLLGESKYWGDVKNILLAAKRENFHQIVVPTLSEDSFGSKPKLSVRAIRKSDTEFIKPSTPGCVVLDGSGLRPIPSLLGDIYPEEFFIVIKNGTYIGKPKKVAGQKTCKPSKKKIAKLLNNEFFKYYTKYYPPIGYITTER